MASATYISVKHNIKSTNTSITKIKREIKILHESVAHSIKKINRYCNHYHDHDRPQYVEINKQRNECIKKIKSIESFRSQLLNEALAKYTNINSIYVDMKNEMQTQIENKPLFETCNSDNEYVYLAIYTILYPRNNALRNILNETKSIEELGNLKCNKLKVRILSKHKQINSINTRNFIFELYHPFISTCCFAENLITIDDKDILISFKYSSEMKHKIILDHWFRACLEMETIMVLQNIIQSYSEC